MRRLLITLFTRSDGQDLIEYALLAGLISLMAVTAVLNVGGGVNGVWGGRRYADAGGPESVADRPRNDGSLTPGA